MGTRTFAFANFVIILQVVSGVYSSFPDGTVPEQWNYKGLDIKGATSKKGNFMLQKKPLSQGVKYQSRENTILDDVYESQLPAPPTQKDISEDTRFEDEIIDNANRGTSDESAPVDKYTFSGAGHLETNEIIKKPISLPEKASIASSKTKEVENNKMKEGQAILGPKSYNFPELDKAVEKAVNNLPSSDESPLVPLIKIFNKKIDEESNLENGNPEEQAMKKILQKHIVLKLANKVQKEKERSENGSVNQSTQESQVQEQQKEDEAMHIQNPTETNEGSQPCDCEDMNEEGTPQDHTEPEVSQSGEEEQKNNNLKLRVLAHVIVLLRKPKFEDTQTSPQPSFSPLSENSVQSFQPRKTPELAPMILSASASKPVSINTSPSLPFQENDDVLQVTRTRIIAGIATGECGDKGNEDEDIPENDQASFSRFISNGSEEEISQDGQGSFPTFAPNDQYLKLQDLQRTRQFPPELILLKHLTDVMKEKAAADALQQRRDRQSPQFFPLSAFGKSSNSPPPTIPRLVLIRPSNQQPQNKLLPLYIPDENSGYEIKQFPYRVSPKFREIKQDISDSEGESIIHIQPLNDDQEVEDNDNFAQQPNSSSTQELPWFIRNIIANLSRPVGENNLQPIPTKLVPVEKPAEEKSPVMFRAFLAPYAL